MYTHLLVLCLVIQASTTLASYLPVNLETRSELNSRLTNVHVSFEQPIKDSITYTYGACDGLRRHDAHHAIGHSTEAKDLRLVWVLPEDMMSGGCIHAWDSRDYLVGRSEPQFLQKKKLRRRGPYKVQMANETSIDALGPWFNGVALLQGKNLSVVDVEAAKSKDIAIVGAGAAGLMTYLVLHQAGLTNLSIIEASQRLGGRIDTAYLSGGPFDYSYQDLGPMRLPETVMYSNVTYNITEHQLVFQLANEMNRLNNHDKNFSVDFIPWFQSSPNGLVYKDGFKLDSGLPPTVSQVAENNYFPDLDTTSPSYEALSNEVNTFLTNETFLLEVTQNVFKAHRDWIDHGLKGLGGDTWSEFAYMVQNLNASMEDAFALDSSFMLSTTDWSFWSELYVGAYFKATTWKTIDGGMSRLPLSFHPLVDNVTSMNRKIERVQFNETSERVNLQWKKSRTDRGFQNASYDYAIFALPFSMVKRIKLPALPEGISQAIQNVPFGSSCKVALEYRTRFWERFANPIYGGCSTTTDAPGIGYVCYPSYCLNCTGPATLLASYSIRDWGDNWVSVLEEDHVRYVVDAMIDIHGQVARDEYTGKYVRRCWRLDEYEAGSWASPTIGMHQTYIPEYFKTYSNMIFVGEQTSCTHGWIASALESGIRGGVQLLLELGLVDEAKAAVDKWMARWIEV